jgi:hypothetical protein
MPSNGLTMLLPFAPLVLYWGFILWAIYTAIMSLARISRNTEEANALLRELLARQAVETRLPPAGPQ